jgi:DNA uptake protein ComE-like DNA-binding protein
VLIVTAILMLVSYQFFRLMSAEMEASQASNRITQSRYLADSGLHYAALVLSYPQTSGLSDTADSFVPIPGLLYDNPDVFHLRPVAVGSGQRQGFFSIVAPRDLDDPSYLDQGFRFGVEDEGGKLNLNAILKLPREDQNRVREMIVKLPNMTEELVDSIFNWMQAQTSTSTGEGDSLYYSSLGYSAKKGPFESLEELLLVKGITPRFLLGNDRNRNGMLEPDEDDAGGFLDSGLSRYLTIYSRERNVDAQGQPRIYLNDNDLVGLWDKLNAAVGEELANFIVGYRLYAQPQTTTTMTVQMEDGGQGQILFVMQTAQQQSGPRGYGLVTKRDLDFNARPRATISSVLDLVSTPQKMSEFGIPTGRGFAQATNWYMSPIRTEDLPVLREYLPLLFDKTTTKQEMELPPRININTAPRELLLAFPNLQEEQVDHILELRPGPDTDPAQAAIYRTPSWLVTEAGFDPAVVKAFEPYITTRSQVYRVQVVGYHEVGGPTVRIEAVIDTNNGRPKFLYWRDITELGRGFNLTGY